MKGLHTLILSLLKIGVGVKPTAKIPLKRHLFPAQTQTAALLQQLTCVPFEV